MKVPSHPIYRFLTVFFTLLLSGILVGCATEDNKGSSSSVFKTLGSWGMKARTDGAGDVYLTGFAYGDVENNSGEGEADVFVAKYDTSGDETAFDQHGSEGEDHVQSMVIDPSGDIYVVGYTDGELESGQAMGNNDIFVMKYNSAGARQWVRQYGTTGNDYGWDIAADSFNNLFLVGYTDDVFPGSGATNAHGNDILLIKLDSSGNEIKSIQLGKDTALNSNTFSQSYGVSVAVVDAAQNVVIGAITNDVVDDSNSNIGGYDIVLAKYDNSLTNRAWITQLGTAYNDSIQDLAVHTNHNIYFTGFSNGTPDASHDYSGYSEDDDYTEVFLYKYNSSGSREWVKQAGTASHDRGYGLAIDGSENIYVTGNTNGDLSGTNAGSYDFFVLKYDATGTQLWKRQYGSDVYDTADGIAADGSGNLFVTGKTYGTLDSKSNDSASFTTFISKYDASDDTHFWTELF